MQFTKRNDFGIEVYSSESSSDYKIYKILGSHRVIQRTCGKWRYIDRDFKTIESAKQFIESQSKKISNQDIDMICKMYGFDRRILNSGEVVLETTRRVDGDNYSVKINILREGSFDVQFYINYDKVSMYSDTLTVDSLIYTIDEFFKDCGADVFQCIMCGKEHRSAILCASSRDMLKNIVRVKSSNVWGYYLDIKNRKDKTGDLIVQFKNKTGGPGDVYMYFDVPVMLYRKWHSATSVGHFFWQYIRNDFKYRKLTGDKRGKLKNAVN